MVETEQRANQRAKHNERKRKRMSGNRKAQHRKGQQKVDKVSVGSIIRYVLVLLYELLFHQLGQSLVKPVYILRHAYVPKRADMPTCHSSHQRMYASGLSGPTGPEGHHAVSDSLCLKQLDDLKLPGRLDPREEVLNQAQEEWLIFIDLILTNLDKFMSLRTLMTMVDSVSLGLARLAAPRVLSTERMFRRPKS
ncbi:hypothetical protein EYF80_009985 [Liparis tanakae]|uniref:Uncharacterized protein n=1 Tax=Liparis tanakae TaxID=230148 RepID=A0A4Z2IR90_9TELE|nr:hypothetical protein EYF80_009985 [Liparis tanakae]